MPRAGSGPLGLEELARLPGTVVVARENVLLQVRRGELTEDVFDRIAAAMRRHRVRIPRGTLHAVVAVVEEGAPIPTEAVRTKQRATVVDYLKDPATRFATVVAGDGIEASLLRSASRAVVPSHPHLRIFGDAHEACAWLASELGIDAVQLARMVDECRTRAATA